MTRIALGTVLGIWMFIGMIGVIWALWLAVEEIRDWVRWAMRKHRRRQIRKKGLSQISVKAAPSDEGLRNIDVRV